MKENTNLKQPSLTGVHAAIVCPLNDDGTICDQELADHAARMTAARDIRGLLVNGHAGEGHLLSPVDRRRVLEIIGDSLPASTFITAGVTSESTRAACEEAETAAAAGADAVLVFPPSHWFRGVDTHAAVSHHRDIAVACGLPVVLYKAPLAWGAISYAPELLGQLIEVEAVSGIKEGSWEVSSYEEVWRLVKHQRPEVSVMASGDEHLLACLQVGTDGSQVSLAALFPDLVTELYDKARQDDWTGARAVHERLYPLARAIYRTAPSYRATARLKSGLKLMGQIRSDRVLHPMCQLDVREIATLRDVLEELT